MDGILRIKANSLVAHGQLNLSLGAAQFRLDVTTRRCALPHSAEFPVELGTDRARFPWALLRGISVWLKSISTFCCSDNSLQKLLAAATMPRSSSFEEWRRCDRA